MGETTTEKQEEWKDMKIHTHLWKLSYTTLQWGYKHSCKASYGETEPTVKSLWNNERKTTDKEGGKNDLRSPESGSIQTH